ncbi:hypothetical protein BDZ88DRAFT_221497 [Geranomyces variabilis]|nr:hypothetical protein BDZ88DRAFT_221497 [Geranomyces variabilis]
MTPLAWGTVGYRLRNLTTPLPIFFFTIFRQLSLDRTDTAARSIFPFAVHFRRDSSLPILFSFLFFCYYFRPEACFTSQATTHRHSPHGGSHGMGKCVPPAWPVGTPGLGWVRGLGTSRLLAENHTKQPLYQSRIHDKHLWVMTPVDDSAFRRRGYLFAGASGQGLSCTSTL